MRFWHENRTTHSQIVVIHSSKLKKIFLLYLFVIFISCSNQSSKKQHIVFKDTITKSVKFKKSKWNFNVNNPPIYVGKEKDTILINYQLSEMFRVPIPTPPKYYFEENNALYEYFESKKEYNKKIEAIDKNPYCVGWFEKDQYRFYKYPDIELSIDTTQRIKKEFFHFNDWNDTRFEFYYAFPVIIKNKSIDTIKIGYNDHINLKKEALSPSGKWNIIEGKRQYKCRSGSNVSILPPDEIMITNTFIYSGDFKTKLRLKLGDSIYSNIYDGYIDKRQFRDYWEHNE